MGKVYVLEKNPFEKRVLAHFKRAGVEIALILPPTVLICSYCYKPILLLKVVFVNMYSHLKFPSQVYRRPMYPFQYYSH